MSHRHLGRMIALQTLFEWDFNDAAHSLDEVLARNLVTAETKDKFHDADFTTELVRQIIAHLAELNALIEQYAPEWPLPQITVIDRNVLRLGLYELYFNDQIPPRVAINEAIELAKSFGGPGSGRFVNGVLGSVYRHMQDTQHPKIGADTSSEDEPGDTPTES